MLQAYPYRRWEGLRLGRPAELLLSAMLGLLGMNIERAALVGWQMPDHFRPGKGAEVRVLLPSLAKGRPMTEIRLLLVG